MLCRGQNTSVTVFAPAKLNLFLKILRKRGDGYHELETLMVSVGSTTPPLLMPRQELTCVTRCRTGARPATHGSGPTTSS